MNDESWVVPPGRSLGHDEERVHERPPSKALPNNALQLTRSHGTFRTWSRFAAPRAMACGVPSQLNAVFGSHRSAMSGRPAVFLDLNGTLVMPVVVDRLSDLMLIEGTA